MIGDSIQSNLQRALQFLQQAQNSDGAWGYQVSGQSFAEPTCYSLLALHRSEFSSTLNKAFAWFASHTNNAGALSLVAQNSQAQADFQTIDNWGTLLAAYTFCVLGQEPALQDRYYRYVLASAGNRIDKRVGEELKLNYDLLGWSWARGTAGWVEPTAYGVLALKAKKMGSHERVQTGTAFLLDRACYDGGWNYGNKEVLQVKLEAMPTNTCFALMALQDEHRSHEVVQKSVRYLETELAQHQSSLLLALGILSLDLYERPTQKLAEQLMKRQLDNGSWRDNVHVTALAAIALQAVSKGRNIFKLSA